MIGASVFTGSVRGALHIARNMKCEDYVGKFENERFKIFVTADGHGSKECCRSSVGAQIIVNITIDKLKEFVENYLEIPSKSNLFIGDYQKTCMKELIAAIFTAWKDEIRKDVEKNPFTEIEYESVGEVADYYRDNIELEHAYGTTLIAGVLTDNYLILIHQGDGRCIVFNNNGKAYEPVPWDDRCIGKFTTSVSDKDSIESCRFSVLPVNENKPLAVFLCSDGVEDSFRKISSTYGFCRKIIRICCEKSVEEMQEELSDILIDLNENGSEDDTSISGYICVEDIRCFLEDFQKEDEMIELESQMQKAKEKLLSMTRKREYLKKQYEIAKQKCEEAKKNCEIKKIQFEENDSLFKKILDLNRTREDELKKACEVVKEVVLKEEESRIEYEEYENRYQFFLNQRDECEQRISNIISSFSENEQNENIEKHNEINNMCKECDNVEKGNTLLEKNIGDENKADFDESKIESNNTCTLLDEESVMNKNDDYATDYSDDSI